MKSYIILVLILSSIVSLHAQDEVMGKFWSPKKDGKMEIFRKQDGKYYGKFLWVKDDRKDIENPNAKLRDRMVSSIEFMYGFQYKGNGVWEDGKIYDPESGKTYDCIIKLTLEKHLLVRGYIGISLLGRTETFERIKD